ncbi:MAG: hypothetical protein JWM57_4219 [Phycisphaerales bacterium]|nr:hypothetical protein [Phycisphaerales bacterium]
MIQIDDDWKRQAQEEKRKLAEREAASKKPAPPPPAAAEPEAPAARPQPDASFSTLVQAIMTQALYYLGELGEEGEAPLFNMDVAKHQIDTLAVIEAKTKGNLSADEQSMLDQALYDLRSRFVSIATQMIR